MEQGYRGIPFPFAEVSAPTFSMEADWTLDELLGYVGIWSAVSRNRALLKNDPVPLLAEALLPLWGPREDRRRLEWPLALRIGRHPAWEGGGPLARFEAQ